MEAELGHKEVQFEWEQLCIPNMTYGSRLRKNICHYTTENHIELMLLVVAVC